MCCNITLEQNEPLCAIQESSPKTEAPEMCHGNEAGELVTLERLRATQLHLGCTAAVES